jgi:hypothetical protein
MTMKTTTRVSHWSARAVALQLFCLLWLGAAPALPAKRPTYVEKIAKLPPTALGEIITDRAEESGDREKWLGGLDDDDKEYASLGRPRRGQVLLVALHFAIARQVDCIELATADPEKRGKKLDADQLRKLKNRLMDRLRSGELSIDLDLDSREPNRVEGPHRPKKVILTSQSFWQKWGEDPEIREHDQLPQPAPPGWEAVQRAVIHELAHGLHGDDRAGEIVGGASDFRNHTSQLWKDFELYLWDLWTECKSGVLADFGDACPDPAEEYFTYFFSPDNLATVQSSPGTIGVITTCQIKKRGAHHLDTRHEWLGPAKDVDRELDTRCRSNAQESTDNGVSGLLFDRKVRVVLSVADRLDDRYADGVLVLNAWVDWKKKGRWEESSVGHVNWTGSIQAVERNPAGEEVLVEVDKEEARLCCSKDTKYSVVVDPQQWGANSRTYALSFKVPRQRNEQGWARFRLYYLADGSRKSVTSMTFLPRGRVPFGEVEDYQTRGEKGELTHLFDPRGDFLRHDTGQLASAPGWSDIERATAGVHAPTLGPWDDPYLPVPGSTAPDNRVLTLAMDLYESIPAVPEAHFASWHFVVDLDRRSATGHPGRERPVGVFPELGVDLWADLIWDGHGFVPYLFLGGEGISRLDATPGLLTARLSQDRKTVRFEVPVEPLEGLLAALYGAPFAVDEDGLEWVAVTNHVGEPFDFEDPPSDFFPDWLYLPITFPEELPPDPPEYPWLTSPDLPGFEAKVRITPPSGEEVAGAAEPGCIIESLCVSGALPGRPEVFVKVIGPRPNGKLWTQISRFTPSAVEVWLRQIATDTIRYYRLEPVGPTGDDVSGLQDREAFDPLGAAATVARGALLPGAAVELLPRLQPLPRPLEPGEPAPPAGLDWLTTPELPGFQMKAAITPVGGPVVGGQRVDLCIPETLCIHGALAGRPEVFAKIIGPRPNGFLWVQAARFTPSQVELWVEQAATGTVRYYRLDPVGPGADDVSGLQDRGAFLP